MFLQQLDTLGSTCSGLPDCLKEYINMATSLLYTYRLQIIFKDHFVLNYLKHYISIYISTLCVCVCWFSLHYFTGG